MQDVPIRDDAIELDKFLKLSGAVDSGGQVKGLIEDRLIRVNGQVETRRRRQLRLGDVVEVGDEAAFRVARRQ